MARGFYDNEVLTVGYEVERDEMLRSHYLRQKIW